MLISASSHLAKALSFMTLFRKKLGEGGHVALFAGVCLWEGHAGAENVKVHGLGHCVELVDG